MQIVISGRVQGVGFRACVRGIALDLHVNGMVMNLADGKVQIYATGEPIVLEKFLSMLYGCPRVLIRDIHINEVIFKQFDDFTIIKKEGWISTGL